MKTGVLTNPKKGDMEQKNNFMKNKLGATIRLGSRVQNWIAFEIIYFLGLFIQGTVFNCILTLILMPDICGQCEHPKVTAITLVALVALVQILQVFRSFDYLGFLFCSSLALLLASFTIHRSKTTVTSGMQLGFGLSEEESSLVEKHFQERGDPTSYDLALVILWIVLCVIIQVCTMTYLKKRLDLPNLSTRSNLPTINKMLEEKKNIDSKATPAVEVYTIQPLDKEKKSEDSTTIPGQPYANYVENLTMVRIHGEKMTKP